MANLSTVDLSVGQIGFFKLQLKSPNMIVVVSVDCKITVSSTAEQTFSYTLDKVPGGDISRQGRFYVVWHPKQKYETPHPTT